MLARSDIRKYVRAVTNQLDSSRVDDGEIDKFINFSQLQVQNEFAKIHFKAFSNVAYFSAPVFAEPSDMLQYPNSIINLLTGTGVRGTDVETVGATGTLTITAREPGTWANTWTAQLTNTGSVSVSLNFTTKVITMGCNATVTTIAVLLAALNADPVFTKYFLASATATSETILNASFTWTLASGTGAGWYPADETSSENFVRIESNTFKAPSATSPKYRRFYNGTSRTVEVLPDTINFAMLEYYRRLADLDDDTDTLGVGAEIEELVILKVIKRVYEKLEDQAKIDKTQAEYDKMFAEFTGGYIGKRKSEIAEKERLQSADKEN